ncbi:glycosyl transferase family 1 [Luteimonas cucumeris]|uniref:Glycosyl transferase family 1 n=1 Tax=Luteimonas cucumeris TaxID=985012 RepID=A0A562LEA4_9GAMM|nr:glycosyltransferase [Luteimonas cucumeris]TWI05948.1 glycosyl transferase family 1 [Luteimonas cucumeris]
MPVLNLIAWDNGVGLSRDLRLLATALEKAGYDVRLSPVGRGKLRKWSRPLRMHLRLTRERLMGGREHYPYDANIMLEHIRTEDIPFARRNFFVPNPEWCLWSDVSLLPRVDAVLTKTRHAETMFSEHGHRVAHVGFTSEDRYDPSVARDRCFFHLAGRSQNKGTQRLLELWRKHPEWPRLTVVQNPREAKLIEPAVANIDHRVDYIDDAELRRLQNAHWFHLCPSETEGFGHYLVEAMSVAAVAITTDAAPMNELVQANRGVLVDYASTGIQHLATTYFFDESVLEARVEQLLALSDDELKQIGRAARDWFLANDRGFSRRLRDALEPLLS